MRVVFFGSGDFAVPPLRSLAGGGHEIAAVVTQPDRPAGRNRRTQPTPVAGWAEELGLPLLRCPDVNEPAFVQKMAALRADLGVVAAFGQKLHTPLRQTFGQECINLHASLLPKYRGAAPIAHAILADEKKTGVTVFKMIERMDAGPIILQRQTMIGPGETGQELHDRLAAIACDALRAGLELFARGGAAPTVPQDESQATQAPKLRKRDGYMRFDAPAPRIVLLCRAMWSWPGARCRYIAGGGHSEEVTISLATALPLPGNKPPGTITDVLTVAAGEGTLEIHSLKPAGRRLMSWQDFVNGRHVRPGERFETIVE